jgi:iron-regulated transporter 1
MTSYLMSRNMQLGVVGFWRGISSAIGLLGTLAYRKSVSTLSLESTGQWSIIAQFICLLTCYASLFVHNNTASMAMLIGGTCCSRVGLWVFDLSVIQLMQQHVPEGIRGTIGGVQESLQAMFTVITFILGICFPNPRDFHYFIELGCSGVGIATICFTTGIYMNKNQRVF